MSDAAHDPAGPALTGYQKRLFLFLSVATFFEGYDFIALSQILPNLRDDMGLSKAEGGALFTFINAGTVAAYFLVRLADRWGRRRLLAVTIAGYTVFTFASGLAPDVYWFAGAQLLARVFLIAEWATAMVYAAEEFPAARRGMVIGVISGFTSLGSIACAGVAPLLIDTAYGWRTVYLVAIVPLVLLAFARRSLRESTRFARHARHAREAGIHARRPLLHILRTPFRRRVLQMALIWATVYLCTNNAVSFWKDFAVTERGLTDAQVGGSVAIAAVVSMPMVFLVGPLLDRLGRKPTAVIVFVLTAAGVVGSYNLTGRWPLTGALSLSIFGAAAVLPVLNAFTTELFPTELRGDAFAWANNLLGRIGYVLSPLLLGVFADEVGWGPAVSATALAPIVALGLVFWLLPETAGVELEDTAALPG